LAEKCGIVTRSEGILAVLGFLSWVSWGFCLSWSRCFCAESGEAIIQQETADVVAVVEQEAATGNAEEAWAIVPQNAWTGRARAETETGAKRGPKGGRAFKRAEAIFLAVKDWNRLNPSESFAFNAGILETVFKVHRQAAKDFFEAYQNELWEYHQEIGVESPKWHNRGKDMGRLRAFVKERTE
jgi:hypothetical protein